MQNVILFAFVYCIMLVCNRKYGGHLKSDFANRSQHRTLVESSDVGRKTRSLRLPSNLTIPVGELMSHLMDLLVKVDGLTKP